MNDDWVPIYVWERARERGPIMVNQDLTRIRGNTVTCDETDIRRNDDEGVWEYRCPLRGWRPDAFSDLIDQVCARA